MTHEAIPTLLTALAWAAPCTSLGLWALLRRKSLEGAMVPLILAVVAWCIVAVMATWWLHDTMAAVLGVAP